MPADNKKVVVAVVGGLVVIAGAAWYFMRTTEPEEAPKLTSKKHTATAANSNQAATEPAAAGAPAGAESSTPAAAATAECDDVLRTQTTMLVNEYSFSGEVGHDAKDVQGKTFQPPVADRDGNIDFESVGVSLQLARGWQGSEEPSPMPNVALLAFSKPEFAERDGGMPGAVPMVLLSIEDVSNERITVEEFKEKSKMMALSQMAMMTGGAVMPQVREDEKLPQPIGPFTHTLMYELRGGPGFPGLQVLNLTAMQDGLAYIFQIMSNPSEFLDARKNVVQMAKSMKLARRPEPEDFITSAYISMSSVGGSIKVPSAWTIEKAVAVNPVFVVSTASTTRKESIEVYNAKLDKVVDLSKSAKKSTTTIRGVEVCDYGSSMRVATLGDVIVVATARHGGSIVTPAHQLVSVALNTDFAKTSDEDRQTYHNPVLKVAFEKRATGRIVESRLSSRMLVYAPMGLPQDPSNSDDFPMLTFRVGDPSNDPDCRATLDQWMERIRDESDGETISDLKKDKISNRDCVTFSVKEMQEIGPGQREERTAKMIIFLTGVRTTMLRWETSTGTVRKHESKLKSVLNSLVLS